MEMLNIAARAAQPMEINMKKFSRCRFTVASNVGIPWHRHHGLAAIGPNSVAMTSKLRERSVRDRALQSRSYPHYRIIILDDDVNTFQHVVDCLVTFLPGLTRDQAWAMARQVDGQGSAVVWVGPQEQAELYHVQLGSHGLTMAPLEPA